MHTKALLAIATVFAANAAFAAVPFQGEGMSAPAETRSVASRAEVLADLAMWQRAGLDQFNVGDVRFDPQYEAKIAQYQRLRHGPEYLAELSRLQAGQAVAGSATNTAH